MADEPMKLADALDGKHGPDVKDKAEQALQAAVEQIERMIAGGTIVGAAVEKFAKGGLVSPNATLIVGNGDREHWVPVDGSPEPTRAVVYRGTTLRSRVKVKGHLIVAALKEC